MLAETIKHYTLACFSGQWVRTYEPEEVKRDLLAMTKDRQWTLYCWNVATGIEVHVLEGQQQNPPSIMEQTQMPGQALAAAMSFVSECPKIVVMENLHLFLQNPPLLQTLINALNLGKSTRTVIVVLSPNVNLPPEIEKLFTVIDHDLPSPKELADILRGIVGEEAEAIEDPASDPRIKAAGGMTRHEAENAFTLSLVRNHAIVPQEIFNLKALTLKRKNLLTLHEGKEGFDAIGGLKALKNFCLRALKNDSEKAKPKGVLLLGVPGTGKSAFAKALGREAGRPTLILDIGSMFQKHVGETENNIRQALAVADAMAPCVLFVDEIEKALAGVGSNNDSGVATRLFGALLTWLADHTTEVFFVGTCNDVSALPPEFARAERFDATFFIDLPTQEEREAIWKMYRAMFDLDTDSQLEVNDSDWTGAEIRACCRTAAMLGISIKKAAEFVVPVAKSSDKIQSLRKWAEGRTTCAANGGPYMSQKRPAPLAAARRRNIQ